MRIFKHLPQTTTIFATVTYVLLTSAAVFAMATDEDLQSEASAGHAAHSLVKQKAQKVEEDLFAPLCETFFNKSPGDSQRQPYLDLWYTISNLRRQGWSQDQLAKRVDTIRRKTSFFGVTFIDAPSSHNERVALISQALTMKPTTFLDLVAAFEREVFPFISHNPIRAAKGLIDTTFPYQFYGEQGFSGLFAALSASEVRERMRRIRPFLVDHSDQLFGRTNILSASASAKAAIVKAALFLPTEQLENALKNVKAFVLPCFSPFASKAEDMSVFVYGLFPFCNQLDKAKVEQVITLCKPLLRTNDRVFSIVERVGCIRAAFKTEDLRDELETIQTTVDPLFFKHLDPSSQDLLVVGLLPFSHQVSEKKANKIFSVFEPYLTQRNVPRNWLVYYMVKAFQDPYTTIEGKASELDDRLSQL